MFDVIRWSVAGGRLWSKRFMTEAAAKREAKLQQEYVDKINPDANGFNRIQVQVALVRGDQISNQRVDGFPRRTVHRINGDSAGKIWGAIRRHKRECPYNSFEWIKVVYNPNDDNWLPEKRDARLA